MQRPMMTLPIQAIADIQATTQTTAIAALESGNVVYCPNLAFNIAAAEQFLLSEKISSGKSKNISYDHKRQIARGSNLAGNQLATLTDFMQRYANFSYALITQLFPQYEQALQWGRTSYRPVEIKDRPTSKRKDDTRLHVDAFPATPVQGLRILRVFCNVNPHDAPRVWHMGEPFEQLVQQFAPRLKTYSAFKARMLKLIKATKTLRTAYDHYMLHLHDTMKLDDSYQQHVAKIRFDFPANSTWIVFTDQVSHAALAGQYLLEQTFYLPVDAMQAPQLSPLKVWEHTKSQSLI
jgi:hypothetical protein